MKKRILLSLCILLAFSSVIAQNKKVYYPWQETRKGLDVRLFGAYSYGVAAAKGFDMIQAEFALGKQVDKMYFGLSSGVWSAVNTSGDPIIPIILEYQIAVTNRRIAPFIALRTGFGINTAKEVKVGKETIKPHHYCLGQGFLGFTLSVARRMDMDVYGGYTAMLSAGKATGYLTLATSFRFHRTTKPKR